MVYKYAEQIKQDVGDVDILINNAGIVCGQTFLDLPDYMIEKTYQVNILSHYWVRTKILQEISLCIQFVFSSNIPEVTLQLKKSSTLNLLIKVI